MSNDINNLGSVSTLITPGTQNASPTGAQTPEKISTAVPTQSADTLKITDSARQLQDLEARAKELPVVDSNRVEQVRQALETGNHTVNPDKVAQKLLQYESYLPA